MLDNYLTEQVDEAILFYSDLFQEEFEKILISAENKGIRVRIVPNFSIVRVIGFGSRL